MTKTSYAIVALIAFVASFCGSIVLPRQVVYNSPGTFGAEGDTNLTNLVLSGTLSTAGSISQTGASSLNTILGEVLVNGLVQAVSGYSLTINATTTLTAVQFCQATAVRIANTTGTITVTLPAATSSYAICGGTAGAWASQLIANDSTNSVIFAPGTGMTWTAVTTGVGTSTLSNTASTTLISGARMFQYGQWTGTSTFVIMAGPMFK